MAGSALAQTGASTNESWFDSWTDGGQWYVGAKAGGNWITPDTNIAKFGPGSSVLWLTTHYDDGYIGALQFGYWLITTASPQNSKALTDQYNQVERDFQAMGKRRVQSCAAIRQIDGERPLRHSG